MMSRETLSHSNASQEGVYEIPEDSDDEYDRQMR